MKNKRNTVTRPTQQRTMNRPTKNKRRTKSRSTSQKWNQTKVRKRISRKKSSNTFKNVSSAKSSRVSSGKLSGLKQDILLLEYIKQLSPKEQKKFIRESPTRLLHILSEISLNLMRSSIPIPPKEIDKLRPYEDLIYKLSQKKYSTRQRRQIAQTGGFVATLLGTVLPILVSTILGAASK